MDSRERTFLALEHQEPDRVPIDCWMSTGLKGKLVKTLNVTYEQFLDNNDVDLRYIMGPSYIGPAHPVRQDGSRMDIWGVPRNQVHIKLTDGGVNYSETYKEVVISPLQNLTTVEEILDYGHWPSADWFDYSDIEKQCSKIRDSGRVVVFMEDRLNRIAQLKPAMYLRGSEQIFIDMIQNQEIAKTIFKQISHFYLEYESRILESARGKIDILCTGDDFGAQTGPLVSIAMWKEFLKEVFWRYIQMGQSFGALVMHHTCGSVYSLIPEMIDCKLDILQSLQPEATDMNPKKIKDRYGRYLSFQGGVSIQKVLPHCSQEEVEMHVQSLIQAMAREGGFIACTSHNAQVDTPIHNLEVLFRSYREFGKYPI